MPDPRTENFNWEKPDPANNPRATDVPRMQRTFDAIDEKAKELVDQAAAALDRENHTGDDPATKVLYTPTWTGAAPVYISDLLSQEIHSRKFGILGNMTDETAKLNALFAAAYGEGKTARLGKGAFGVTGTSPGYIGGNPEDPPYFGLFSRTPKIVGEGPLDTIIYPMEGFPSDATIMLISPNTGDSFEFPRTEGFLVFPGFTGSILGGNGIILTLASGARIGFPRWKDVYVQDCNRWSMIIDVTDNPASSFAMFEFDNCHWFNGIRGRWLGDTGTFDQCKFHTTKDESFDAAEKFSGVDIDTTRHPDGNGGTVRPSVIRFTNPNYTGIGPAMTIRSGRHIIIDGPNLEVTDGGTGGPRNCVIDLIGDIQPIDQVEVKSGLVAAFGTTNGVVDLINVGTAREATVDKVAALWGGPGTLRSAVHTNAGAVDTMIGRIRTTGGMTQVVLDEGVGTMGIRKTLAVASPFEASSLLGGAFFTKDAAGTVRFSGGLSASGGGASDQVAFTLPERFRPDDLRIVTCQVLTDTGFQQAELQISQTGDALYNGPAAFTRLPLDGRCFEMYSNAGSEAV
jgi:hypothetical protein